jgi:hypothetical protein
MHTKEKKYLKDEVANIILTSDECLGYVEKIVSSALDVDLDLIKNHLILKSPRINTNVNLKYSTVDSIYEYDDNVVNIEVNMSDAKNSIVKNMRYVCHLVLDQIPPSMKDEANIKPVIQINIDCFDYFHEGDFIYKSYLTEQKYHKIHNEKILIININMDYLSDKSYNV